MLSGEPPLDEPFRLVEFVGPLGDRGGRPQQERLRQRVAGLREQGPYAGHRLPGRDQPAVAPYRTSSAWPAVPSTSGERSPVSHSHRYTS